MTADTQIRQFMGTKLTDFFLYEVRISNTSYTFYYMNATYFVTQAQLAIADIGSSLTGRLAVKNMTAGDLAKEQLIKKYPELATKLATAGNKYEDFYTFSFGTDITASIRFVNYRFEPNKPIKTTVTLPGFDTYDFSANFFDMFGLFTRLDDPRLNACVNLANKEMPELATATVSTSSSLPFTVPGTNGQVDTYFFITLGKAWPVSSYDLTAVYGYNGVPRILLIKKIPGILLYS